MMKDSLSGIPLDQLQLGSLVKREPNLVGTYQGLESQNGKLCLRVEFSSTLRHFIPIELYGINCHPLSEEEVEKFRDQRLLEEERKGKATVILDKLRSHRYSIADFNHYYLSSEIRDSLAKLLVESKTEGLVFMGDSGNLFQQAKNQKTCWLTTDLGLALAYLNPIAHMLPETALNLVDWKKPNDLFQDMGIDEIRKEMIPFSTIPSGNIRATVILKTTIQDDYLRKSTRETIYVPSVTRIIRNKTIDNPLPEV